MNAQLNPAASKALGKVWDALRGLVRMCGNARRARWQSKKLLYTIRQQKHEINLLQSCLEEISSRNYNLTSRLNRYIQTGEGEFLCSISGYFIYFNHKGEILEYVSEREWLALAADTVIYKGMPEFQLHG